MNKKNYMVFIEGENTPMVQHDNFKKAKKEAQSLADKYGKKTFVLKSKAFINPNPKIDSFEAALEYLDRPIDNFYSSVYKTHKKSMTAIYKLITIAEAWNKMDNFIPDLSNYGQCKYYPMFEFKAARFVCVDRGIWFIERKFLCNDTQFMYAVYGSRLCFKTSERAEQFGKQFIDLWNDYLL